MRLTCPVPKKAPHNLKPFGRMDIINAKGVMLGVRISRF